METVDIPERNANAKPGYPIADFQKFIREDRLLKI